MFIVSGLHKSFPSSGGAKCARPIRAYDIPLLRSGCLWVTFGIYKHSAPLELRRLVAAAVRCAAVVQEHPN